MGWKVLASLALALSLAGSSHAGEINFQWELYPFDAPPHDPQYVGGYLVNATLSLERDWWFGSIEFDTPANALGESLGFDVQRYGYTDWFQSSNGGLGGGIFAIIYPLPGTHAGVFDRVYLPDGSWREASVRITAYYRDPDAEPGPGPSLTVTVPISVTILASANNPAIIPEPASIASASVAILAVGGFLARKRLRRG